MEGVELDAGAPVDSTGMEPNAHTVADLEAGAFLGAGGMLVVGPRALLIEPKVAGETRYPLVNAAVVAVWAAYIRLPGFAGCVGPRELALAPLAGFREFEFERVGEMGPVVWTKAGLSPTSTESTGEALESGCGSGSANVNLGGGCVGGCCTVTAGLVVFAPWAVFAVPEAG